MIRPTATGYAPSMWGSWFGVTLTVLLAVLLLIAIAFGTSALLFPVLIAAGIGVLVVGFVFARRMHEQSTPASPARNPRSGGAPASGEGSGSPTSPTGSAR